jgi:hypothetical protein
MPDRPPSTRPITESVAILAGTAINGIAAYLYIAIGTRTYGDVAMAPVAVLWTFWAISVALFMFPLQHWAIRQISVDGSTNGVGGAVPRITAVVVGAAALLGIGAWIASDRLFGSSGVGWAVLVFLITIGSAFAGLQRGVLSGLGRYYATAANIAGENLLRLTVGIAVAAMVDSVVWFAATLALGPLVAVFWPETFRLPVRSPSRPPVFVFLSGLAGGLLLAQVILNAGPVVLQAIGGADAAVTALFLSLALFRAPYLLALGAATRLTAPLTELVVAGATEQIRRIVTVVAAATVGGAVVAVAGGYYLGPWIIDVVFAPTTPTTASVVAAIAAGSVLALGGLGLILILTAHGRTVAIQGSWAAALGAGIVLLIIWPGSEITRVVAAFVGAEGVALTAMAGVLLQRGAAAPIRGTASTP